MVFQGGTRGAGVSSGPHGHGSGIGTWLLPFWAQSSSPPSSASATHTRTRTRTRSRTQCSYSQIQCPLKTMGTYSMLQILLPRPFQWAEGKHNGDKQLKSVRFVLGHRIHARQPLFFSKVCPCQPGVVSSSSSLKFFWHSGQQSGNLLAKSRKFVQILIKAARRQESPRRRVTKDNHNCGSQQPATRRGGLSLQSQKQIKSKKELLVF